jgi:hypothetical protein
MHAFRQSCIIIIIIIFPGLSIDQKRSGGEKRIEHGQNDPIGTAPSILLEDPHSANATIKPK